MPINEKNFLDFAKSLMANSSIPSEFDCRNAISRAYYSAYHAALNKESLANGRCVNKNAGVHKQLIEKFCNHTGYTLNDRLIRTVGLSLRHLKNERVKSDYDLKISILKLDAEKAVREADKLLTKISSIH